MEELKKGLIEIVKPPYPESRVRQYYSGISITERGSPY